MSELDEIQIDFLRRIGNPPQTSFERKAQKSQLKALMLDVFCKALKGDSIAEMGDIFRKEVREL